MCRLDNNTVLEKRTLTTTKGQMTFASEAGI